MPSSGMSHRVDFVIANDVPSSPILVTLMMEAIRASETSAVIRATRRNSPEDILYSLPVYVHCFVE
jgi:hypothetical protein